MMRLSKGERADDPLGKACDTWLPETPPFEIALEDTFRDGIKFAAELPATLSKQRKRHLRLYRPATIGS